MGVFHGHFFYEITISMCTKSIASLIPTIVSKGSEILDQVMFCVGNVSVSEGI